MKPGAWPFVRDIARRLRIDERGGVITLAALSTPVLAVAAAGALELAEVVSAKSKLQTYVDTAALNGARQYSVDRSPATVERNRLFGDSLADALRLRWTVDTTATTDTSTGSITITQSASRPSFFGSLLPPGGFKINASATAISSARRPLCVLALETSSSNVVALKGSSAITAPDCLVQSDSDLAVQGSATIQAGIAQSVGTASGSISPAAITDVPVMADPFAGMPITVPSGCDDLSIMLLGGTTTLNPGVHCGNLSLLGGGTLFLNPGEHYFVGGSLALLGNVTLAGTDVAVILKGQAAVSFAGTSTLSLDGRKSGPYAGFVLVTDRSFHGTLSISTTNAKKLYGTIYIPNGTLDVKGNNNRVADQSPWTIVVAKNLAVSGSANLVINASYSTTAIPVPSGVGPGAVRLTR